MTDHDTKSPPRGGNSRENGSAARGRPATLDPVLLEIMRHKVEAIADEICLTLLRTCRSVFVNEAADFAVGLIDLEGEMFALGAGEQDDLDQRPGRAYPRDHGNAGTRRRDRHQRPLHVASDGDPSPRPPCDPPLFPRPGTRRLRLGLHPLHGRRWEVPRQHVALYRRHLPGGVPHPSHEAHAKGRAQRGLHSPVQGELPAPGDQHGGPQGHAGGARSGRAAGPGHHFPLRGSRRSSRASARSRTMRRRRRAKFFACCRTAPTISGTISTTTSSPPFRSGCASRPPWTTGGCTST